jgi:hypothetical protein
MKGKAVKRYFSSTSYRALRAAIVLEGPDPSNCNVMAIAAFGSNMWLVLKKKVYRGHVAMLICFEKFLQTTFSSSLNNAKHNVPSKSIPTRSPTVIHDVRKSSIGMKIDDTARSWVQCQSCHQVWLGLQ